MTHRLLRYLIDHYCRFPLEFQAIASKPLWSFFKLFQFSFINKQIGLTAKRRKPNFEMQIKLNKNRKQWKIVNCSKKTRYRSRTSFAEIGFSTAVYKKTTKLPERTCGAHRSLRLCWLKSFQPKRLFCCFFSNRLCLPYRHFHCHTFS